MSEIVPALLNSCNGLSSTWAAEGPLACALAAFNRQRSTNGTGAVDRGSHRMYLRGMKAFFVDTTATILFFTVIVGVLELLVVGLEPKQVLITRLFTLPVIALTGRPYGLWRDWVFVLLRPSRRLTKVFVDVGAFVSFQLPVYVTTLAFVGATAAEMLIASGMAIVGMSILSRPFGLFLEFIRKRAGTLAAESGNLD